MEKTRMIAGPIFKTLVVFSLPMVIINLVQVLFHSADVVVLSIMTTDADVAAVGACGTLISILVCLFGGYSSAANVVVAKRVGAQDIEGARRATGTALVIGLLSGIILMTVTLIFANHFLIWTNCQPEVIEMAALYMRIYFLGMPITMLYNFIAAILRATGDSVRPMMYMMLAGVLNVILNFLFVGAFALGVAGVAIATVFSNFAALVAGMITLLRNNDYCKVEKKNLRLSKDEFLEIMKIGIPSCIAGISFYAGEAVVISSVNAISTNAMTANTIASQIDRFIYSVGSSIASATGVIVSQNYGAEKFSRIPKIMKIGAIYLSSMTIALGVIVSVFSSFLLGLFTDSDAVVSLAKERLIIVSLTNFITCSMEVMSGSLRALKRPRSIMVVGIICGFLIRSIWPIFIWNPEWSLAWLFVCLPLSTLVGNIIYMFVYRSAIKEIKREYGKLVMQAA